VRLHFGRNLFLTCFRPQLSDEAQSENDAISCHRKL
jgi:hypothetical protein